MSGKSGIIIISIKDKLGPEAAASSFYRAASPRQCFATARPLRPYVVSNGTLRKGVNSRDGRYVDLMSALCRTVVGHQSRGIKMKGDTLSQR